MRRAAIICAASFAQPGPRVGMQFLAQTLARSGYEVHFISQPSSPFDCLSPSRRERFRRAWLTQHATHCVEPNLIEHFVRAPFPVHKRCWLWAGQYNWYGRLLPRALKSMRFDVCLHDSSTSYPLLEHLRFDKLILRLSDHPEGFGYVAAPILIRKLLDNLDNKRYDQTWAASERLLEYLQGRYPGGNHHLLSNGVEVERFLAVAPNPSPRSAVFVGSLDRWVDWPLLMETARLLPEWRIDLYGPARDQPASLPPNLVLRGPVGYEALPRVLAQYAVGLIPFRGADRLIDVMDRPLKFYEYLAAGLGIAATDVGGLRRGMGSWARFGTTPASYADAIRNAAEDTTSRRAERTEYLRSYSWEHIGAQALAHVRELSGGPKSG
jgi:glycosyltransferase involved in cell wall biosynthesis